MFVCVLCYARVMRVCEYLKRVIRTVRQGKVPRPDAFMYTLEKCRNGHHHGAMPVYVCICECVCMRVSVRVRVCARACV